MSYNLSPVYQTSQFTNNGQLLVGGKIYWYQAGTTTPVTVYQDSQGVTAFTNPIILDARGEPSAPIWLLGGQAYKAVLQDANGVQLQVIDNITGVGDSVFANGSFPNLTINSTGNAALLYQSGSGNLSVGVNQNGGTQYTYTFNNTGEFSAPELQATNGLILSNATISASYQIPGGYNAISPGPVTVATTATVTVPNGSTWSIT